MKYTINELANSKGVSQLVREALLQMADYKQLYEQVCEQYDVLAKEFEAIKQALAAPVQEPVAYRQTGWAAHRDQYAVPVLFNPYTGQPRDVRDVQSDPQGILIVPPGKIEMLAAKPTHQQGLQVDAPPAAPVQEPVAQCTVDVSGAAAPSCEPLNWHKTAAQPATEVLRLSKDGIWANPDIPADDAAKLVLEAIDDNIKILVQKAVLAEREACAKVCFGFEGADPLGVSLDCAAAIRARSCPPCNDDCDQGRNCPARSDK